MEREYPRPAWWALYAILPLVTGLLFLESQITVPALGHQLLELAIVCVAVTLFGLWIAANAVALETGANEDQPGVRQNPRPSFRGSSGGNGATRLWSIRQKKG